MPQFKKPLTADRTHNTNHKSGAACVLAAMLAVGQASLEMVLIALLAGLIPHDPSSEELTQGNGRSITHVAVVLRSNFFQ